MTINKIKPKETQASIKAREFDRIFQENWERVYGITYRIVGDPAEAEDIALETFLRYHQKPPRFQTNIHGWLYRVATNLALNALRSRRRRGGYENRAGLLDLDNKAAGDPLSHAEIAEERRQVRKVLSQMRKRQATILIMRYSGFSYAEIAETIGTSSTSIGTLLARAEREFEKHYHALGFEREMRGKNHENG